jgi:endonuclease G, mitochondrial
MIKLLHTISLVLLGNTILFAQKELPNDESKNISILAAETGPLSDSIALVHLTPSQIYRLEIPKTRLEDTVIKHTAYSLLFNEAHHQASWVAYTLKSEQTHKIYKRTNKFLPDPLVKSRTANDKDYAATGFDKGHLAPASDMGWSSITMRESFYYSNMSPQVPSFNRGIWKKLEELVRNWAIENSAIEIITGPILTNDLSTIGANNISVPNYFYKVILDYRAPGIKGIAFVLPNSGSSESLQHFAVSIDKVEDLTGIDFFPLLPDDQEELIEKTLCIACWSWKTDKNE